MKIAGIKVIYNPLSIKDLAVGSSHPPNSELAKTPVPSLENIVKTVAQKNNPGEASHGIHVWEIYHRL